MAFLAFVLGFYFPDILSVQMYAYTMYGATITPALICALFYKKATKAGGLAGIITGAVTTIIWDVVLRLSLIHILRGGYARKAKRSCMGYCLWYGYA